MKSANAALHTAKETQSNSIQFFYKELKENIIKKIEIEKRLKSSIYNKNKCDCIISQNMLIADNFLDNLINKKIPLNLDNKNKKFFMSSGVSKQSWDKFNKDFVKYIKNKEPKSLILYFKFFYVICILKF